MRLWNKGPKLHGHGRAAERAGETLDLDTRPASVRFGEFAQKPPVAASFLTAGAATMLAFPFVSDMVLPAGIAFAAWVFTRPVRLPFDLPERSGLKDRNNLHPVTNKPLIAEGRDYLGTERGTGAPIWQAASKSVQHRLFPGSTGAGKTDSALTICVDNAIAQGSGVIAIDGKGSIDFYTRVLAKLHQAGLEDQLFVINCLGGESNTTNPFATASADMIREIMIGQLSNPGKENEVFLGKAVALLGILAPILRWVGDQKGICIDLERVRDALELPNIIRMARHREIKFHYDRTGEEQVVDLAGMPNEYVRALRSYLGGSGGFDVDNATEEKKPGEEPSKQHSYIEMQFIRVFTAWLVSLGHVFRTPTGDVDMFDVVMNRRFLVVLLPSLKSSAETTQGLGKYVVAMLKATMGLAFGEKIQGDYADVVENLPSFAQSAFKVFFDEGGGYATNGMDTMFAMARQLMIEFNLGFQEIGTFKANLGQKTSAVLGNPNTVMGMRLQDPDTGEFVQRIGGEVKVAQVTQQQASKDALDTFREPELANIQTSKRFNWLDLRKLTQGQAIISYGDTLIHANLAYLPAPRPDESRINRLLTMDPPDRDAVRRHVRQVDELRTTLLAGPEEPADDDPPVSKTLLQLLKTIGEEIGAKKPLHLAAFDAVLQCPDIPDEQPEIEQEPAPTLEQSTPATIYDPPPEDHTFSEMLRAAASAVIPAVEFADPGRLPDDENELAEAYAAIERFGGRRGDAAKKAARHTIGGLKNCIGPPSPKPERISNTKLLALVRQMAAVLDADPATTKKGEKTSKSPVFETVC